MENLEKNHLYTVKSFLKKKNFFFKKDISLEQSHWGTNKTFR